MEIRILLIGPEDFLSFEAAATARAMGVTMLGPYGVAELPAHLINLSEADGMVIDIRCDASEIFDLIDACEAEELPCIIALNYQPANAETAYVLSERVSDLMQIALGIIRRDIEVRH